MGEGGSPAAQAGAAFLEQCLRPDGGLATYPSDGPIRTYVGLGQLIAFDGWTQSHVCVAAAGANLERLRSRLAPFLLGAQAPDGGWRSYWWFEDAYATAEAVAALTGGAAGPDPRLSPAVARAVRWACRRARLLLSTSAPPPPPAFALAELVRILARGGEAPGARALLRSGVERLLAWQAPGGSFPASARLRAPRPDRIRPEEATTWRPWTGAPPGAASPAAILAGTFDNYSLDHRRLFTTATVLRALGEASKALDDG